MATPGGAKVPSSKGAVRSPSRLGAGSSSSSSGKNAKGKDLPPPPSAKLRVLCLHGFRTSAKIMEKQLEQALWIPLIDELTEFVYMDAPHPATGKSDVEKKFEAPYFEWYQANEDFTETYGLEEAISQITAFINSRGPFDGLFGFSQGGLLAGALVGLQEKGLALQDTVPFKFVILIGAAKSKTLALKPAYFDPITTASLHFLGEKDFMKEGGEALVQAFKDPIVIHHPHGHLLPRLAENDAQTLKAFLRKFFDLKNPDWRGTPQDSNVKATT